MISANMRHDKKWELGYKTFVPHLRLVQCPVEGCARGLVVIDMCEHSRHTVEYKCCDHNRVMLTVSKGTTALVHLEEGMAFDVSGVETSLTSKVVGYFDAGEEQLMALVQ